jgi:hypothetical protein
MSTTVVNLKRDFCDAVSDQRLDIVLNESMGGSW